MERNTDIPPSVNVSLPPEIDREIRELAEAEGTSWTVVLHGALWCFRGEHMTREERQRELVDLLRSALDSGPGKEATPINDQMASGRVIPLISSIARMAGDLRRLYPRLRTADSAIAATALFTNATLITRNVQDFRQIERLALLAI